MTADTADNTADAGAGATGDGTEEGYTGTAQASRALRVTPRTVRRMHEKGELEGRHVKRGRSSKVLEISIASLKRARDERIARGLLTKEEAGDMDEEVVAASDEAVAFARAFENLARDRERLAAEAATHKTRAELTERTESTKDAELREERERREAAEREAERLRGELEAERRHKGGVLRWLFGP